MDVLSPHFNPDTTMAETRMECETCLYLEDDGLPALLPKLKPGGVTGDVLAEPKVAGLLEERKLCEQTDNALAVCSCTVTIQHSISHHTEITTQRMNCKMNY